MSKPIRILLAFGAGFISLIFSIMLYLVLFEHQGISSTLGVGTAVAVMFFTYRNIKPTEKELREDNTKQVENFHPNGIPRERGELVYAKKEGAWEYYNEEGVLIREDFYENDKLIRSVKG